jgi:hypothetical protein
MKTTELAKLLTVAKATDSRIEATEFTVAAWSEILDPDLPYDFARIILARHYAESKWPLMPADIVSAWRTECDSRSNKENLEQDRSERRAITAAEVNVQAHVAAALEAMGRAPRQDRRGVLAVACSWCKAGIGENCVSMGKPLRLRFAHDVRSRKAGCPEAPSDPRTIWDESEDKAVVL